MWFVFTSTMYVIYRLCKKTNTILCNCRIQSVSLQAQSGSQRFSMSTSARVGCSFVNVPRVGSQTSNPSRTPLCSCRTDVAHMTSFQSKMWRMWHVRRRAMPTVVPRVALWGHRCAMLSSWRSPMPPTTSATRPGPRHDAQTEPKSYEYHNKTQVHIQRGHLLQYFPHWNCAIPLQRIMN